MWKYNPKHPKDLFRFMVPNTNSYIEKRREGKGVVDSSGNKVASILLTGLNRQSILLSSGTQLKFQATGKESWAYTKNGKEAISGYYYVWENKKYFIVHRDDSTITNSVVPAIFLGYGLGDTHRYHNSKRTGLLLSP
jgi:hypothetical protein